MVSSQLEFEIVSPEGIVISCHIDMVVIPGTEGYFGVLAGHIPLISTLRPGVISMYQEGKIINRLFIARGFAEVTQERCTVLADKVIQMSELDRPSLEQEIRDLTEDIEDAQSQAERQTLSDQLSIVKAKLEAYTIHHSGVTT